MNELAVEAGISYGMLCLARITLLEALKPPVSLRYTRKCIDHIVSHFGHCPNTEALIDEALFKELCVHMFVEACKVTVCLHVFATWSISVRRVFRPVKHSINFN
jgi:hypothetical protein